MGYINGLVALAGLGGMLLSMMDSSITKFLLSNLGVVISGLVFLIGAIGFFAGFNSHTHPEVDMENIK
jgi:hypothetical protein